MFHLVVVYGQSPILPGLRTVDIFLAPSPELQRPPRMRRAWHTTYYNFRTVDTASIGAATPDLLELGNRLLGLLDMRAGNGKCTSLGSRRWKTRRRNRAEYGRTTSRSGSGSCESQIIKT